MNPPLPRKRRSRKTRQLQTLGVLAVLGLSAWGAMALLPWWLCQKAERLLTEDPKQAESLLIESIERADGDYPKAQILLARVLGAKGQWIEAAGSYALIKDPARCPVEHLLAFAEESQQAGQGYLADLCLKVISEQPDVLETPQRERVVHLRMARSEWQAAREQAEKLIATDADHPLPILVNARFHKYQGEFPDAVREFERYLAHPGEKPDEVSAREELAGVLIDLGEHQRAREELEHLQSAGPLSVSAQITDISLLRLEGRPEEALEHVESLLKQHPDHAAALLLRGTLRLDLGETQAAISDLKRALELNPYRTEAHFKLGTALVKIGQPEEAEYHFQKSQALTRASVRILELEPKLAAHPDQPDLLNELSELYREVGREADATRLERYLRR